MGTLGLALRTPPCANVPLGSVDASIISSRILASSVNCKTSSITGRTSSFLHVVLCGSVSQSGQEV